MAEYDDFHEIYGDEYDALLEIDDTPQNTLAIQKTQTSHATQNETIQPAKRTLEELFGEIDDILAESPYINAPLLKKQKTEPDLQLIDRILQLREGNKYQLDTANGLVALPLSELYDADYSTSYTQPKWPYVKLTQRDGRVKYVRFHNLAFQEREVTEILLKDRIVDGETTNAFKQTLIDAQDIIKRREESELGSNNQILSVTDACLSDTSLWADRYKPKCYFELLSDESTNRTLLRWLKLWDKVVFKRKLKLKSFENVAGKFVKQDVALKLSEDGRPEFKIALLCGPPGLGKTTLAHLVARHAGYNTVEINASDERNVESFRATLDRGTRMRSVLARDNRPNCIIFDEIDGAPSASVQFLIKYASGAHKDTRSKRSRVLKRPIICICNDMYVPSLRPLKQISFVVNFPPTDSSRLAQRLLQVATQEGLNTDLSALTALSEKTNSDIRSCLSALQFFRAQNKPVLLDDVLSATVGLKDVQLGLFAVWRDIFQIEKPTSRDKMQQITAQSRMRRVLNSVTAHGEYSRLMQGIFDNYPDATVKGQRRDICASLERTSLFDLTNEFMMRTHNYSLNTYLPYAFVTWHFTIASFTRQNIRYPNTEYEVRTKQSRNINLLDDILKGTQTTLKPFVHKKNLNQDILPFITNIISPTLRPVSTHLYTHTEKQTLRDIVAKMIDFNITYVQERTVNGDYVYAMDPNIAELTDFSMVRRKSSSLSYTNKQLIACEISVERLRRIVDCKMSGKDDEKLGKCKKSVPNHLQQLKVVWNGKKEPQIMKKNIFGNIAEKSKPARVQLNVINDICFVYNEGFTNAIRRPILMKDFI